jgi:ribosomal protein S19
MQKKKKQLKEQFKKVQKKQKQIEKNLNIVTRLKVFVQLKQLYRFFLQEAQYRYIKSVHQKLQGFIATHIYPRYQQIREKKKKAFELFRYRHFFFLRKLKQKEKLSKISRIYKTKKHPSFFYKDKLFFGRMKYVRDLIPSLSRSSQISFLIQRYTLSIYNGRRFKSIQITLKYPQLIRHKFGEFYSPKTFTGHAKKKKGNLKGKKAKKKK